MHLHTVTMDGINVSSKMSFFQRNLKELVGYDSRCTTEVILGSDLRSQMQIWTEAKSWIGLRLACTMMTTRITLRV